MLVIILRPKGFSQIFFFKLIIIAWNRMNNWSVNVGITMMQVDAGNSPITVPRAPALSLSLF